MRGVGWQSRTQHGSVAGMALPLRCRRSAAQSPPPISRASAVGPLPIVQQLQSDRCSEFAPIRETARPTAAHRRSTPAPLRRRCSRLIRSCHSPARTKYQSGSWGHSSLKVPVLTRSAHSGTSILAERKQNRQSAGGMAAAARIVSQLQGDRRAAPPRVALLLRLSLRLSLPPSSYRTS